MNLDHATAELWAALSEARKSFGSVTRDIKGQEGNRDYMYADLAQVLKAAEPHLAASGLTLVQSVSTVDGGGVDVHTVLAHKSGGYIDSHLVMPWGDGKPKAIGSAMTYGRRYAAMAILGQAPEDDDGSAAQDTHTKRRGRAKAAPTSDAVLTGGLRSKVRGVVEVRAGEWWGVTLEAKDANGDHELVLTNSEITAQRAKDAQAAGVEVVVETELREKDGKARHIVTALNEVVV